MFNHYIFGEPGPLDKYNPRYYLDDDISQKIVIEIAKRYSPFHTLKTLSKSVDFPIEKLNELIDMNLIKSLNGHLMLNFPLFLEEDIQSINGFSTTVAERLGKILLENKSAFDDLVKTLGPAFSTERHLYHMIGDKVFDGEALDYFADKGLFRISKEQAGNRDYIVIGYEKSEAINQFSNKLLCSSNNYRVGKYLFNSFGDSMGNRNDAYRFTRNVEIAIAKSPHTEEISEAYNLINHLNNQRLFEEIGEIIEQISKGSYELRDANASTLSFMKSIGYIGEDLNLKVPVYKDLYKEVFKSVCQLTLDLIEEEVIDLFGSIDQSLDIVATKHKVDIKDICNELWHQVFGGINEYLIENGFFIKPYETTQEGRFMQAIFIK